MDEFVALLVAAFAWFAHQPIAIQAMVSIVVLAGLYTLLVVARLLVVALYGAFRGLG